ncbi:MAG: response regulator transcription factor [Ferruginibacter sp.]|nr:response regulator transcription factor [Cytophagales bacterium]
MQPEKTTKVVLVDDHTLLRKGMVELINGFTGYTVVWEANNGKEFTQKLSSAPPRDLPDIVVLDINMPEMDGYQTALWLKQHHPEMKFLALSMYDDETAIIRMLRSGARGYVLKDAEPSELKTAFHDVVRKGFYHSELVSITLVGNINKPDDPVSTGMVKLSAREAEFLKLSCTELTYKQIADQMCLGTRAIDGYREALFEKLHAKSRIGLVLYAIKYGIVKVA